MLERPLRASTARMNKQNPDRGIETRDAGRIKLRGSGMNKQNPDRGIETKLADQDEAAQDEYEQTESRPRD